MLIDTHCHLNDKKFKDNIEETLKDALDNDVSYLVVVGYDKKTNKKAIELAKKYPFIYASVGFHPTEAVNINDEDLIELESLLQEEKVVAVGECGLDYYWDKDHKDIQRIVFEEHIRLSKKYDLPLIIHNRDSTNDVLNILRQHSNLKGVMHCYSGSKELVHEFIETGMYISLGGPVTFKNAKVPKEVAKMIPSDKILIETDSPWLSPHPYRGKQNSPAKLHLIAKEVSMLRGLTYKELGELTTNNAKTLFKIN